MRTASRLRGFLATLVVAALASVPVGEAVASVPVPGEAVVMDATVPAASMAGMAGMESPEAMPCCPEPQKQPPEACDKSACPTMYACAAQCIPAGTASAVGLRAPDPSAASFRPGGTRALASLARPPPPRPPRV